MNIPFDCFVLYMLNLQCLLHNHQPTTNKHQFVYIVNLLIHLNRILKIKKCFDPHSAEPAHQDLVAGATVRLVIWFVCDFIAYASAHI